MTDLAEVVFCNMAIMEQKAIRDLREKSEIHLYDDVELINVLTQRKSVSEMRWRDKQISGDKRSIYMKLQIKSRYFANYEADKVVDVLILQSRSDYSLSFHFNELPEMNPKFVQRMTEQWGAKEETEL